MITQILAKIMGTNNARQLRRIQPIVDKINAFEPAISSLSDEALAHKTTEFREQLSKGKTLDDILPEAFAVVREASKRETWANAIMMCNYWRYRAPSRQNF